MSVLIKEWDVGAMRRPGSSAPAFDLTVGSNFPWNHLKFDPASDEVVYVFGVMPESDIYTADGDVEVEIDWVSDTSTTGTVRWKVQLLGRADGEAWDTAFSDSATEDDPRTAGDSLHIATVSFTTPSLAPGDRFILALTREGTHANDTYDGTDAHMVGARLLAA
ncbi:MAG: hypothetical protein GY769_04395 [bacterium]|nr:hypothetical protein [bacterium]